MPIVWDPTRGRYVTVDDQFNTPSSGFDASTPPASTDSAAPQPNLPNSDYPQGPANNFGARHPKLAQFLQNLAPALAAIPPSNRPEGGETPINGVLRALGQGAQAFAGAKTNIENDMVQRSPVMKSAQQKLQTGRINELTPGEIYVLGQRAPQNFLSAGQQAQGQRIGAGLETNAYQGGQLALGNREAATGERQAATAERGVANQEQQTANEMERFNQSLGLQKSELADRRRQTDLAARKLGQDIGAQFAGSTPKERMAAIKYGKWVAGVGPQPDQDTIDLAESLPTITEIDARAKEASAGLREGAFAKAVRDLLATDGQRLSPEDQMRAQRAAVIMMNPGFSRLIAAGDKDAQDAITTWGELFPTVKNQSWGEWFRGFFPDLSSQSPQGRVASAQASGAQAEMDALRAEVQKNGSGTPAQKKRYEELLKAGAK